VFQKLLKNIARILKKNNIPYMVIGGQAVIIYGEPRQTKDIDVTLGIDTDRYDVMHTAVKALELEILPDDIEQFIQQTRVLPTLDPKSGIRVDFIFSFSPYERQAIRRAHEKDVQEEPVRFATVEDVIIHKLTWLLNLFRNIKGYEKTGSGTFHAWLHLSRAVEPFHGGCVRMHCQ